MPKQKITKRKDGRFSAMVSVGHDPETGKLKRKTVYGKTKSEVRAKVRDLEAQIARGEITPSAKGAMTVCEWADIWLEEFASKNSSNTVKHYTTAVKSARPIIGAIRLDRLSPIDCQRFANKLRGSGLKESTIKKYATVISTMLGKAAELGYMAKNPMDGIELPKARKPDIHPFDEEETRRFAEAAQGSRYRNLYMALLFSGLRISEALALDWESVEEDCLRVTKQFSDKTQDMKFHPTKNRKEREVPLSAPLKEALEAQKALQDGYRAEVPGYSNPKGLVFTDPLGGRLSQFAVLRDFKRLASGIGCPKARLHDLRHTYAVLNLKAGVDPKSLSEALGHSSVSFTLDRYAYVTKEMRRESARKLGELLGGMGLARDDSADDSAPEE